ATHPGEKAGGDLGRLRDGACIRVWLDAVRRPYRGGDSAIAASKATVINGAGLLAAYSLGLGLLFIGAAIATQPFVALVARYRRQLVHFERVAGCLLVLTGAAFLLGAMPLASLWLLEAFPRLGQIG